MLPIKNNLRKTSYSQKGKMRYSAKKYSNPFFQQRKRHRISIDPVFSWKFKLISGGVFLLALFLAWFLLYSNFFVITNIQATGEGNLTPEKVEQQANDQIKNNLFILWPQKNIFLFNIETLRATLEKKYSFETLEINKKLPRTLNINYKEKKHSIIWQEGERYFYANKDGAIINETTPLEIQQKDYPLINNLSGKNSIDNRIQIDSQYLEYTLSLFEELKRYPEDFQIDRFIIDNEVNTVKVALINGPQLFFNTNELIEKQISKVLIIKKEKIKDSFNSKSYIDVRIGDSVYFR